MDLLISGILRTRAIDRNSHITALTGTIKLPQHADFLDFVVSIGRGKHTKRATFRLPQQSSSRNSDTCSLHARLW